MHSYRGIVLLKQSTKTAKYNKVFKKSKGRGEPLFQCVALSCPSFHLEMGIISVSWSAQNWSWKLLPEPSGISLDLIVSGPVQSSRNLNTSRQKCLWCFLPYLDEQYLMNYWRITFEGDANGVLCQWKRRYFCVLRLWMCRCDPEGFTHVTRNWRNWIFENGNWWSSKQYGI